MSRAKSYHNGKQAWRAKHGPDYSYIPTTRAKVAEQNAEIEF